MNSASASTDGRGAAWLGAAAMGVHNPGQVLVPRHPASDYARDFRLADTEGHPRSLADFKKQSGGPLSDTPHARRLPHHHDRNARSKQQLGRDGDKLQSTHHRRSERGTPRRHETYMQASTGLIALIPARTIARTRERLQGRLQKVEGKTHKDTPWTTPPPVRLRHARPAGLYARYGAGGGIHGGK